MTKDDEAQLGEDVDDEIALERRRRHERIAMVAILAAALLGIWYFLWRTPGEPCNSSLQCRGIEGFGEASCKVVAQHGKLCTLACDRKTNPRNACPGGLGCKQIVWESHGESQTGWFCLPP
jgi:hypothetical protein